MWARLTSIAIAIAVCCPFGAIADEHDSNTVDLGQALANTLERNPTLLTYGYQLQVQSARIDESGLRPALELGLALENFAGSGLYSGTDSTEATVSLTWVIERGKRERRVDTATARLSLFESEAQIGRIDAAATTANLYLDSLANQALKLRAVESTELAKQAADAVRTRVDSGRTPLADLARAEAVLAQRQLGQAGYQHLLSTSLRKLAAQWGETRPAFERVAGTLTLPPAPMPFASMLQRVDGNPNLMRFLSEQRLREAEVRMAESQSRTDWRVSAGVRHLQQSGDQALVASLTMPMGSQERSRSRVAAARAELARTESSRLAERILIETRLFVVYEEYRYSLHVAATLRDEILPRMERALSEAQRAYSAGRYSFVDLQTSQDNAMNARTQAILTIVDANRLLIEIERLTGTAINGPVVR